MDIGNDLYIGPRWQRSALITIDAQRDVLPGGAFEVPGTEGVLPAMKRALQAARRADRPVVHVVRLYLPDGSNVDLCRRARIERGWGALTPGQPGSELAPELVPAGSPSLDYERLLAGDVQPIGENEIVIYKPRWGAFYETPLEDDLRNFRIDTLAFIGSNYANCPRASIYEASERDYRVAVLADAISGFDGRGADEMQAIGVALCTVDEYQAHLSLLGTRGFERPDMNGRSSIEDVGLA